MTPDDIRLARKALNLTQANLALAIGAAARTVARYESGQSPIPAGVAAKLKQLAKGAVASADPRAGQITKATHGDLYAIQGKSIVMLIYHPVMLFPDLPWPVPPTLDCCPASVLYTPRYALAVVEAYKRDLAHMGAGGETSVLRPKAYTDEMAAAIELAFNEAVAKNKLRAA